VSKKLKKATPDGGQEGATPTASAPKEVKFDYIKSNFFRIVHADGVFGGVSPHAKIYMTFWSSRPPIPTQVVHRVTVDGTLGEEIRDKRTGRDAIIREAEVGVLMDLDIAKSFRSWLDERIKALEKAAEGSEVKKK
jgi:hypothetical protein